MAGLCYDTPQVEVILFPVAIPEKTSGALSYNVYQDKCPPQLLAEKLRKNFCLLSAGIQEKKSASTVVRLSHKAPIRDSENKET